MSSGSCLQGLAAGTVDDHLGAGGEDASFAVDSDGFLVGPTVAAVVADDGDEDHDDDDDDDNDGDVDVDVDDDDLDYDQAKRRGEYG